VVLQVGRSLHSLGSPLGLVDLTSVECVKCEGWGWGWRVS
jgi:hypothetical protein